MNKEKYQGIIPAFYACYDEYGQVSIKAVKELTRYFIDKGVKGVYVGGSSGECIYLNKEERKQTLEAVMEEAKGKLTVIAHVACNNTTDSMELAAHAQSLGVDAIASIPPIYFHLPEHAIAQYWNDISSAAPDTDFIIYNIPQLAGVSLTVSLLQEMLKNSRVIGVKNSSMPVQDIQLFQSAGGPEFLVFNGPDEQYISGRVMGAVGGIGGTYAVMPELFLEAEKLFQSGEIEKATKLQYQINDIIYTMCSAKGNMYAVAKEVLKSRGLFCGSVRKPLAGLTLEDKVIVKTCVDKIEVAMKGIVSL